jgi:hypothetical protein
MRTTWAFSPRSAVLQRIEPDGGAPVSPRRQTTARQEPEPQIRKAVAESLGPSRDEEMRSRAEGVRRDQPFSGNPTTP